MVTTKGFGMTNKGEQVTLYTIDSGAASVSISDFGANLVSFNVPDKNGVMTDIVLGYDDAAGYDNDRGTYFGATVGRFGNRIKGGKFTLNGKEYILPLTNNGHNCLHGGINGFTFRMYDMEMGDNWVCGTITSPDGEEGFPGNLKFTVKYTLVDTELSIEYFAESDADTVIAFTNHSYFNLNGATTEKTVLNHTFYTPAMAYGPVDEDGMFTGLIRPVEGTLYDFRTPALLGDRLSDSEPDLATTNGGIDNYFPCKAARDGIYLCSSIHCEENGIGLDCHTDQIGVQVYTSAFIDTYGKKGTKHSKYAAICLETQGYPNSPNLTYIDSPILKAGEKYYSKTVYTAYVK